MEPAGALARAGETPERALRLREALDALVAGGLIEREQADTLLVRTSGKRRALHPLVLVVDQQWKAPPVRPGA